MPRRKNRKTDKKSVSAPKKKAQATTQLVPLDSLPNALELEEAIRQLVDSIPDALLEEDTAPESSDPIDRAQEVVYDAWEAPTKGERIRLAKQALEISPLCADAYALLAEMAAKDIIEARDFYLQAVDAGEKAIGPEAFEEDVGHFWGIFETRPYMRARAGLADCLWDLGERQESVAHLQDLLRLNPDDNQGLRYILTAKSFKLGDLDTVKKILSDYPEDGFADWSYSKALLIFRQDGASVAAEKALRAALDANKHVPGLLLGSKKMPKNPPPYYAAGSKDEAVLYVFANQENWSSTRGALQWLADTRRKFEQSALPGLKK